MSGLATHLGYGSLLAAGWPAPKKGCTPTPAAPHDEQPGRETRGRTATCSTTRRLNFERPERAGVTDANLIGGSIDRLSGPVGSRTEIGP